MDKISDLSYSSSISIGMIYPHVNYSSDYRMSRNYMKEFLSLNALERALRQAETFIDKYGPRFEDTDFKYSLVKIPTNLDEKKKCDNKNCKMQYKYKFPKCPACSTLNSFWQNVVICPRDDCKTFYLKTFSICHECGTPNPNFVTCPKCQLSYHKDIKLCPKEGCQEVNPILLNKVPEEKINISIIESKTNDPKLPCSKCERLYKVKLTICPFCGTPKVVKLTCKKCGHSYDMEQVTCDECGTPNPKKSQITCKCGHSYDREQVTCDECGLTNPTLVKCGKCDNHYYLKEYVCCDECGTDNPNKSFS